ncbi:MAG: aldo/keto reductase [Eggerthellaceae bacterium]|nr:aldo/keto reductase [Eggerthellaceae bacterium]
MASWTDEVQGRLGFGCMRLPGGGGEGGYGEMRRMVDTFLGAGFNYFDTARPYHGGKSETALRECLVKRHPRESFFLTDKLTHGTFRDPQSLREVFQSELEACGVGYFDMLLAHAVNAAHYDLYTRCGVFDVVPEFLADGRARHFGISFHDSPDVLERILGEHPEIEAVQIQFNYADFANGAVQSLGCYEVCERHGVPCLVMEPVKGGSLVNLPAAAQAVIDALPNPEGLSNAGLALRFAASYPNNKVVLSGMSDLSQMEDNIRSMADPAPLPQEFIDGLMKVHDVFRELGMVECTACHYCTDGCPRQIMIPEMLGALNTKRVFGGWNPGWYYSNSLVGNGHGRAGDCIKCGKCERECPQKLPIRELLEAVSEEFD